MLTPFSEYLAQLILHQSSLLLNGTLVLLPALKAFLRLFIGLVEQRNVGQRVAQRQIFRQARGEILITLDADGRVTVDMGAPEFALDRVPFDAEGLEPRRLNGFELWPLALPGGQVNHLGFSADAWQVVASLAAGGHGAGRAACTSDGWSPGAAAIYPAQAGDILR